MSADERFAMAHIFFETGDRSGGAEFLGSWLPDLPRQAQIYSHTEQHQHWAVRHHLQLAVRISIP